MPRHEKRHLLGRKLSILGEPAPSAENIERTVEYIRAVLSLDQSQLKLVDEKSLNGAEIIHKVRRDPITGEVPCIITDPDF
jgi:hypothetical protein